MSDYQMISEVCFDMFHPFGKTLRDVSKLPFY
jgi:hypothetical protein